MRTVFDVIVELREPAGMFGKSMVLCREAATLLEQEFSRPHLGLATTAELLDEIRARCEVQGVLSYRTADDK